MSAAAANLTRRLLDTAFYKTKALPAAAAANASASVNLGQTTLGPLADDLEFEFGVETTPDLVDAKTIILTVKDSADDNSFAAIPGVGTLTQTGAGGAGAAAAKYRIKLPPSTRQYVRVEAAVLTGGGDNTAKSYFLKIFALA